jgi:hypothetical protein
MNTSILDKLNSQNLQEKDRDLIKKHLFKSKKSNTCGILKTNNIKSGHNDLDSLLSQGGWPLSLLTEIGLADNGIGEVRLLVPALRELQQNTSSRRIVWVAPPYLPLASTLIKEGLDSRYLTIIQTKTIADTVWAYEQALLSESCGAVIGWTGSHQLKDRELRRLQLAAERSHAWSILLRDQRCMTKSSSCHLRLSLKATQLGKLNVHIIKQPQHWGDLYCTLSLSPHYEQWQRLPVALLPQHLPSESQYDNQADKALVTPLFNDAKN